MSSESVVERLVREFAALRARVGRLERQETTPGGQIIAAVPVLAWNETPAGTIDGVNNTFTLLNPPAGGTDLMLYRNGLLQRAGPGGDYQLSGSTIVFEPLAIPYAGDELAATYSWLA